MTVAWGQNAANGVNFCFRKYTTNADSQIGELGFGPNEPKSCTKLNENQPLRGIDVFRYILFTMSRCFLLMIVYSIAAGQNTTFFLAKPSSKMSDLPRHPVDVNPSPECVVCCIDEGNDEAVLQCDKVSYVASRCSCLLTGVAMDLV